jgi:small-conductance mechanosensitive channel
MHQPTISHISIESTTADFMKSKHLFLPCLAVMFGWCLFTFAAYGATSATVPPGEDAMAKQYTKLMGPETNSSTLRHPGLTKWLHLLDKNEMTEIENSSVMAFAPQVPGDLARILKSIGEGHGTPPGFFYVLFLTLVSIGVGLLIVFGAKRITQKRIAQLEQMIPPNDDSVACLWAGLVRSIPGLLSIALLALSSTVVFLFFAGEVTIKGRMVFQLILGIVLVVRLTSILGQIIFAPKDARLRPLDLTDAVAKPLHQALVTLVAFIVSGLLLLLLIRDLGALEQTASWMSIILGTILIAIFCYQVLHLRKPIANALQEGVDQKNDHWIREQLATYWHVPVLFYLLIVWFIWVGQEMTGLRVRNGSFLISLFIVPIFIVISYMGRAVIRAVIDSLGLGAKLVPETIPTEDEAAAEQEIIARKNALEARAYFIFRIILAVALTTWTLSLWGYDIPFASRAISAIFESLVTIAVALIVWRLASTYIARKIEEATPEVPEGEEDDDNEFGGGAPAGRTSTLLPMVRKVLGSFLMVMVILTVLSSLGVNIAPLLAGAGVLGLAVGFGAQKLVSDVLSGFFFLLDDAFRVGEYIQAGSIVGTVETITLRNVMLRHHLGMLQIVPYSDLGAVTNFMRGGIVIKFPLEFSYDTDIDLVRRIIKKVGQAMLEDEELGEDFIQPVKSQGVYQIANSVMVIRVKFTSKPGKQFLIKREAFRRITEALNKKGIYYAHRKVIVDFPHDEHEGAIDEQTRKKLLEAGAASAIATEAEQQAAQKDKKSGSAMHDM